jgi:two-component system chemotaxis sensor kinase CheA
MNTADLLDQFVSEARECLEKIGQRLLDVERSPTDTELLNDLFRQVHTLKGNCGLFDFKDLERVVHAGEDLLDLVRQDQLAYNGDMADALLDAMDYASELVDAIAQDGRLPDGTGERSKALAESLRTLLRAALGAKVPVEAASSVAVALRPDWLEGLPPEWLKPGRVAMQYVPEPDCFFKGEDPWGMVCNAPGLVHLQTGTQQAWPIAADFDCYQCNLAFLLVSEAPQAYLEEHFRYVPDQVAFYALSEVAAPAGDIPQGGDPADDLIRQRIRSIWMEQRSLLARPGVAAGSVAAARHVMGKLLTCWGGEETQAAAEQLDQLAAGAAPLAAWAAHALPGDAQAAGTGAPDDVSDDTTVAPQERRMGGGNVTGNGEDGGGAGPRVLKVGQDKIDRLMDLIGEMVVAKNALPYLAQRAEDHFGQRELAREIKAQYSVINRIAEDMQHAIMQVRMLPVGTVFQRFGRLVRDISKKLGKDVQLVIEGEDTEADKNVIESLADPLIHILRNSLDHGLELPDVRIAAGKPARGTLRVAARQEGDRVILDISDDGAGVDTTRVRAKAVERGLIPADRADQLTEHEAVQLVFLPGFSTAEKISDLSGRGVGMDVVRSAVERVNGSVELSSVRGQGTTIRLALPLSMAVTNVMMIDSAGRRFGVPMDLIVETVRVPAEDIHRFKRAMTVVLRGRIVPLRPLNELLSLDEPPKRNADDELAVLVVRHGNESVGLLVDNFEGTSDIILKPLEGVLAGITGFAGTALMGDGSVLMILNPKDLL